MTTTYSGKVFWANGFPIPNVTVQLFEPGKNQGLGTELTLQPSLSIADGSFVFQSKDSPLLDNALLAELELLSPQFDGIEISDLSLGNDLRPIVQFTYSLKGNIAQASIPFRKLHRGYRLPHNPPVDFLPSRDGFAFENFFRPFNPPITLPDWLGGSRIPEPYGLCGGMSSAAYDFCLAKASSPKAPDIRQYTSVPKTGTRLHRYLLRRSMDTFGMAGKMVAKVGDWTMLPDQGLAGCQKLTLDELPAILQMLDEGQCMVITLIYEQAADFLEMIKKIWLNHQVLAYGYIKTGPDTFEIRIYDSNYPDHDNVVLKTQHNQVGNSAGQPVDGLVTHEFIPGELDQVVRGFFPMNYQPTIPPGF
jgi:hypothetical protein